jgi:Holliday junction resolvasome RuvABC endonuclease subunit
MIYDQVVYVVKRWKPVQGAMEGYSIESVNRPFDLGEAGGMVKLACHQHAVPLITVPPTSLKKFAGNAKADKEGVAKLVAQKWQQHIDQNDECDAYVLAQVARALKHQEAVTVRAELEVLKKLLQEPGLALVSYTPRSINT